MKYILAILVCGIVSCLVMLGWRGLLNWDPISVDPLGALPFLLYFSAMSLPGSIIFIRDKCYLLAITFIFTWVGVLIIFILKCMEAYS